MESCLNSEFCIIAIMLLLGFDLSWYISMGMNRRIICLVTMNKCKSLRNIHTNVCSKIDPCGTPDLMFAGLVVPLLLSITW